MQIGYEFKGGKLTSVVDSPNGPNPTVYQPETDAAGKTHWYARPNGFGNTAGQSEINRSLHVDSTGKLTQMISGEMGADGKTPPQSAYEVLEAKKDALGNVAVSQYVREKDGTAYGFGYENGSAVPTRVDYSPREGTWEHLARSKDASGNYTNSYFGNITTTEGIKPYLMGNPKFEGNGTFSYDHYRNHEQGGFIASGHRAFNMADGSMSWDREPGSAAINGTTGSRNWGNGNSVEFKHDGKGNITSLIYHDKRAGAAAQHITYEPVLKPNSKDQATDADGVPMWRIKSNVANAQAEERAFRFRVSKDGHIIAKDLKNSPQAGHVWDWDIPGWRAPRDGD